jgi:hypothetical protein
MLRTATNLSNLEHALRQCHRSVLCCRRGSPVVTGVLPVPKESIRGMVRAPKHGEFVLSISHSTN